MQSRSVSFSLISLSLAMLLCAAGPVLAATSYVIANVDRVLIYGYNTFGGCMAHLSVSPQSVLAGCQGSWVTFSCTGDFTDQVRAYRMVDVAELALATGKEVQVFFRDDMKHNGYCFAYRIDVLR